MATNCMICGTPLAEIIGPFPMESRMLGTVTLPAIARTRCESCDDEFLSASESRRAVDMLNQWEQGATKQLPIGDFISLNHAAEILGCSKQAIGKNRRIERGFIYSTEIDGKTYLYLPSVCAFKETGDGRIRLPERSIALFKHRLEEIAAAQVAIEARQAVLKLEMGMINERIFLQSQSIEPATTQTDESGEATEPMGTVRPEWEASYG